MGLILPRWGLILPRSPPPTPVLYPDVTHPFWRYVYTQNSPKPTSKHPISWPELESGQNELQSGQFGHQLGKMFEKWQIFSRSGQKNFIHECFLWFSRSIIPNAIKGNQDQHLVVASRLAVQNAPDLSIAQHIKKAMDSSDPGQERHIGNLSNVNINMSGFIHTCEQV